MIPEIEQELANSGDLNVVRDYVERVDAGAKTLLSLLDDLFDAVVSIIRQFTGEHLTSRMLTPEAQRRLND